MRSPFLLILLLASQILPAQSVTVFSQANYGGSSKSFSTGEFNLQDLNDQVSSIRVPAGMVAVLYEHASSKKGYGVSIDLLEDCPDLGRYQFGDKSSFLVVFPAEKDGRYIWVRGTLKNGTYVAGHWERKRATPLVQNNFAVVSPPIPGPAITTATRMTVSGGTTNIQELGSQSTEAQLLWSRAVLDQQGLIGNDYRGIEAVGSASFQRYSGSDWDAIPDNLNFWIPQKQKNDHRSVVYFKRTLGGKVRESRQVNIAGTFQDYDVCVDIVPNEKFQYLINDAHPREHSALMKAQYYASLGYSGSRDCESEEAKDEFTRVEAEIAEDYWPQGDHKFGRARLADLLLSRTNQEICVYGTWISDAGHCYHPEIHPAEQLWWQSTSEQGKKYHLNVLCDASQRFWWRRQMDDGTKLKPWAEPPVRGLFAIAFECPIPGYSAEAAHSIKSFTVENIKQTNVIEYPEAQPTYELTYNGKTLIRFTPGNKSLKASFEHVGIPSEKPGVIRGFLVLETSVGKLTQVSDRGTINGQLIRLSFGLTPGKVPELLEKQMFKKEAGNYLFTVTEKNLRENLLISQAP